MSELESEFGTPTISDEDIRDVLTLTAQDLSAGNFPTQVDPDSEEDRQRQRNWISTHPERYWAFRRGGRIGAYIVLKNFRMNI